MPILRLAILTAAAANLLAAGVLIGGSLAPATPSTPRLSAARPALPAADPALPSGAVRIGATHFRQTGWHSRVFLTDGNKTLVTAGEGALARFWDVATGKKLHEIPNEGAYQDAAFSHAGNLLAVAGVNVPNGDRAKADTALWLIDTAARKVIHTIPMPGNHGGNSQKVCISPDGKRVFVEYEGDIRVIDTKSGEELIRHKGRINAGALALSADGKTIAFGRYEVYLWPWDTGEEPKKFAPLGGFGTELIGFAPDGKTLFVADGSGRVLTFEIATRRQTGSLDLGGLPWKWSFSPDGKTLAVVDHSSSRPDRKAPAVVLWDPVTGKEKGRLPVGHATASHVSWSPDGTLLTAATDYRLWVWDVKTGKPLGPSSSGHEGAIGAFAFGPDGTLFTASDDHTIRSWDAAGKPGLELVHDYWVRDVAVSPDGSLVAGSALRNDLRLWDTKTAMERFRLLGNGELGGRRKVRFTPDGKRLVAWGDDFYLRVWQVRNGKLLAEHRTLPEGATEAQLEDDRSPMLFLGLGAADISADGSTFAFCPYKIAQVFDVATGKERLKFEADPNGVAALALAPDGKRMAIGGRGKSITTRLPNGRTHYSAATKHQIAVWDLAAKKVVWQATSPGSWSVAVAFSPDGARLAESVSTEDKKYAIRLRETATGKDLGRIGLPQHGSHLAFDRTGKRLAVSLPDTTALVCDLQTALKLGEPK